MKRILITGPESTGKTSLAEFLAAQYGACLVEEYARSYVETLDRPYEFGDVEHIARWQADQYERSREGVDWIFFDTWLIITRVWFDVVYGEIPSWLDRQLERARFDLVLLCAPDIPWVPDVVRENGGAMRMELFERYKTELDRWGFDWKLVEGTGSIRNENALKFIKLAKDHGSV